MDRRGWCWCWCWCYAMVCVLLLLLLLSESPRERAVGLGQYSARVFCHGQTGRVAAAGFLDAASRERGGGNINSLWPSSLHSSKAVPYPSRPELKYPSDRHVRVARPSPSQAVDRQQKKKIPLPCAWEGNWHPQCPWPLPESSMPLPPSSRVCVVAWDVGVRERGLIALCYRHGRVGRTSTGWAGAMGRGAALSLPLRPVRCCFVSGPPDLANLREARCPDGS
ncbi:hypothetical protein BS50DRAFT_363812 [Corynespora cassiicola Philippines]|uniref:Secreted protein n=1 Tax=Corynespora cassiicola Philippines TaxID=1448308 RepID=A0A2T2NSM2_CORCC|nr:hypothetical protein BS50DRAFT_363812 [Corynespora cassiicola Philippines]